MNPKIGDHVRVRYMERVKPLPAPVIGEWEMRAVTRSGEVLSTLSDARFAVRFPDGTHRICQLAEIIGVEA